MREDSSRDELLAFRPLQARPSRRHAGRPSRRIRRPRVVQGDVAIDRHVLLLQRMAVPSPLPRAVQAPSAPHDSLKHFHCMAAPSPLPQTDPPPSAPHDALKHFHVVQTPAEGRRGKLKLEHNLISFGWLRLDCWHSSSARVTMPMSKQTQIAPSSFSLKRMERSFAVHGARSP